jgi:hypothetical protein
MINQMLSRVFHAEHRLFHTFFTPGRPGRYYSNRPRAHRDDRFSADWNRPGRPVAGPLQRQDESRRTNLCRSPSTNPEVRAAITRSSTPFVTRHSSAGLPLAGHSNPRNANPRPSPTSGALTVAARYRLPAPTRRRRRSSERFRDRAAMPHREQVGRGRERCDEQAWCDLQAVRVPGRRWPAAGAAVPATRLASPRQLVLPVFRKKSARPVGADPPGRLPVAGRGTSRPRRLARVYR